MSIVRKALIQFAILAVLAAAFAGCTCVIHTTHTDYAKPSPVFAKSSPPAAKAESKPSAPGDSYVWIKGHWEWSVSADAWVWVDGTWEQPPEEDVAWTEPTYEDNNGDCVYTPGYWRKTQRMNQGGKGDGPKNLGKMDGGGKASGSLGETVEDSGKAAGSVGDMKKVDKTQADYADKESGASTEGGAVPERQNQGASGGTMGPQIGKPNPAADKPHENRPNPAVDNANGKHENASPEIEHPDTPKPEKKADSKEDEKTKKKAKVQKGKAADTEEQEISDEAKAKVKGPVKGNPVH